MTKEDVLQLIQMQADSRAKIVWEKLGLNTKDRFYGTNLTRLKDISAKIGRNHELALDLWKSGVHEGKLIATMLEVPDKVTEIQLDEQVQEIKTYDVMDKFCENVVAKTPYVNAKIEDWTAVEDELVRRGGYILLWIKAKKGNDYTDEDFERHLEIIRQHIKTAPNWVKEAMNYALIGIGSKDRYLNQKALKIANEIGEVIIDYGNTGCKNPDARAVLVSDKIVSRI